MTVFPIRLVLTGIVLTAGVLVGCEHPRRIARYPDGALQVPYERATRYSGCLAASVAMASNYLLDEHRFSEDQLRTELRRAGRDETRVGDLREHLRQRPERLHLFTLTGEPGDKPPTGLGFWVNRRGYPVICVIRREPDDPSFNHAVVVIGISANPDDPTADMIHYLDPSSPEPLHSSPAWVFEQHWAWCDHAMMLVTAPPAPDDDPTENSVR